MDALNAWLSKNVGAEERRDEVRAVVESLDDLRWLSEDMLSEHLNLEAWATVSRARFLAAWRELKCEGAPAPSEEAPRPPPPPPPSPAAPSPAEEEEEAEAAPAPAPAEEEAEAPAAPLPPLASAKHKIGARVKARWHGKQEGWYEGY